MDNNPIYKFMKENNLTQMDEASFVKAYSDPQKSAQIHKFMVDNKLTNLDAGAFHSAYFDPSKKKGGTQPASGQPSQQPAKPSTPSSGQTAFDAWNPAFKKAEPETEVEVQRESRFAPKQLDGAYDTWRKSITKEAKDYGLQIGYEKAPEEDEVSAIRKAASDQLGKKSYTPEEQQQIQEIEDKIKKGEEVEMLKPEMGVGTGWRLGEFSLNNSPDDVSNFYKKASALGLDEESSSILDLTNKKAEGSFYGESTIASRSYAEKAANLWFDLVSEKDPSKASYLREKYNKIKGTPENKRSSDDEKFLRDTEGRAIELHAAGKSFRLNRVAERINELNGVAVTDQQKTELDNLFEEYGKLDNSLMGMEKADKLNRMQYGYISRVEAAEDEWKQDRYNKLSQGDGKLSQFFQSALGAMARGGIGIGQVPKVFGDLIGDKDYDYWDETYDSIEGTKRGISSFYNDLPQGKKSSDLPFTARLALVGGNAVGSASLFIGGGLLGGASKVGQTAATFGTAFLTSEADYYQEALDAGMDSQSAALFGTYLATQSAVLESIIPDVKYLKTPEFRRSVRNSVMKRFNSGMPLKESMKFGYKDVLKTFGESGLSYLKTGTKEAFIEELPTQLAEDLSKTAANAAGQKKYFNNTFDPESYVDAILGSFVAGPGMNLLSRPETKSPVQEEVIREIAERKDKLLKKGTASDRAAEPDNKKEIEDTAEILDGMKAHSGWSSMSREEQNHALAVAQQIEVMKKEQERMKELRIPDERKDAEIKNLEEEVNQMFSMQMEQDKQKSKESKVKAIEDDFNKSMEGEEFPVQEDERDQEIVELQKQREEKGVSELDTFLGDMKPMVPFAVERTEQGLPVAQSVKQAASNYLYKKYKELTDMKSDPNRMMTRGQIASVQKQLEQDIRTLEGTTQEKTETRDQENIQGIPSQVREGQEPVAAQPIEGTSQEAAPTGGVLQTQEEVTPEVAPEPVVKPSRRERLAKMFETSDGEIAAEKVASFLGEANIGVEVLDPKSFEEKGKQRNFEGSADGIFLVDNNTGKIYLNKERIKGAEGKTIAFHEGIHPVVNIIRNTNPKLYSAIVDGLKAEAVKNAGVAEAAEAVASSEYYQEQGPSAIEDETVVETMARVAAGDIDIDTFDPSFREKFVEFMNKLAKMLGLKAIAVNSPRMEVKRLADQLSKALNEGGKLSDIVGKKNVKDFQNKAKVQQSNLRQAISDVESTAKALEGVDNNPVYFDNVKGFASKSSFDNKIQFKKAVQDLLISYIPELKKKYGKAFNPSNNDALTKKYLSDIITAEAVKAIEEHPEAIGWYDEKTRSALDVISAIHPEIATDKEARGSFILPLAVMSNGNLVDFNFDLAEKQYDYFKKNGRFNPNGGFGLQQSGIKKSILLINSLLDNGLTMSDINTFLTSKYRAGDLKVKIDGKVKNLASGELADEMVYGAVILGPKIGNGFYMNLWGQFDQLTMDRWFMRTWGRLTGTLLKTDKAAINEGKKRVSNALDAIKSDPEALVKLKSVVPKLSGISPTDLAKTIEKASMDTKKREVLASNPKTDELRKAGNSLSKNISGEKEAPANGNERKFIRDVFTDVARRLKEENNIDITMADLQAVLWYPEKILYESFKGGQTFEEASEGYTSESAPDYFNAAKKLATKLGVNETAINQALSRGRERVQRSIGKTDTTAGESVIGINKEALKRVTETIEKPKGQASKGIKRGDNLVKGTYYESGLTEDKNDYVFFHVSSAPEASIRKGIDSTKYTSLRTAREEKGLQYGVASYYTRPEDGERMVGGEKYAVRVPKGKVYPIDSDPLGYGEKAEAKIPEGTPFRGEAVKREVAEMAKKNGYEMIVGEWSYSRTGKPAGELPEFRADALVPLKPTKEKPDSFTSNAEKGMERIPFPSQQSEQAKQELESIASEVRDIMSSKKKFSSKEYQLADSVYMNGQVTENKYEDNEFKRDITPEEYDMMTKVLPKSMQADAARVRGLLFGKKGQASIRIPRNVKQFSDNVSETVDRIKTATSEDGATLNLDGTTYEDGGLVVPAGSINVAQDDVSAEGLFEFLKDNEGNISSDIFKIGLYKFPDRPEVSYDLNIVIPREYRDVALKFGELAGQESLFDLDTFENIKTGSDGKNPRKFTAQELAEIAKDLSEGRLPKIVSKQGQPSMVKRTSAEVQQLMGDSMDAVDQDIADGVDAQAAVEDNITSQDWYSELTPKQKEQFDEIIKDEFGVTPKAPVAKPTGVKATIANIIGNYYKLKDGDRSARAAINEILGQDPKLKYIYDNISKINKQLQDAGVITDKTDGCP